MISLPFHLLFSHRDIRIVPSVKRKAIRLLSQIRPFATCKPFELNSSDATGSNLFELKIKKIKNSSFSIKMLQIKCVCALVELQTEDRKQIFLTSGIQANFFGERILKPKIWFTGSLWVLSSLIWV